ncbi:MAG: hypothetical protein ACRDCN_13325 [Tannerellaceae bacterium]
MNILQSDSHNHRLESIYNSKAFIVSILGLILISEYNYISYINEHIDNLIHREFSDHKLIIASVCFFTVATSIAVGFKKKVIQFNSFTLNRFLNNALGLRTLGFIFSLIFIFHLSWTGDILLESTDNINQLFKVIPLALGFLGAFLIFPDKTKITLYDKSKRTSLFTGISRIKFNPLEKFELSTCYAIIAPLTYYENINKIILLCSKKLTFEYKTVDQEITCPIMKEIDSYFPKHDEQLNSNEQEQFIRNLLSTYSKYHPYKDIQIITTPLIDYNNIEDLNKNLFQSIKENNIHDKDIIFNVTPGNKNISIVMSFFGAKSKREIGFVNDKHQWKTLNIDTNTFHKPIHEILDEITNQ